MADSQQVKEPDNPQQPQQQDTTELLQEALNRADHEQATELIGTLSSQETQRHIAQLKSDERELLMTLLPAETAAGIIEESHPEVAAAMIDSLDARVAARIIEELPSDTKADIVAEMDKEDAHAILSELDQEIADNVRQLTQYEADTAGGLMELEVFSFRDTETVGAVLRRLTADDDEFERHRGQHPYIVDECGKLVGVVSLRGLLRSKRSVKLADIMAPPISVTADTPQDTLVSLFDEHPFLSIPVVDDQGILLGVVSRIEVAEAELERAEQESLARQRTGDELRSMPTFLRSKRRLTWLSSNIVLNIIAASVISAYEETLAAVIAIAVFLPMVSDMSGCSGNQAVGVSMRELALGLTRPADLFHVLRKEMSVGIINGIVLGILIGIVAWVWKGNAYLGLVIGLALAINTLVAVSIGGTVPLILKRFGVDPAVASGPLLTTVTDMAGFFLVLSLAAVFMSQLLAS